MIKKDITYLDIPSLEISLNKKKEENKKNNEIIFNFSKSPSYNNS